MGMIKNRTTCGRERGRGVGGEGKGDGGGKRREKEKAYEDVWRTKVTMNDGRI